ncbi:MAG: hypothetical protein PVG72_09840 [Gammaproteobacteria bacterium]|jgi:hypothetical protein
MKKLTEDLKRMLAGLASQDAGDYLSMDEKLQRIGRHAGLDTRHAEQPAVPQPTGANRRIAVVINKGSTDAAFSHALQACQRLDAKLDLLLLGPVSRERVAQLEAALRRARVAFQSVYMNGPVAKGIADYTKRHFSLIYLVAAEDDPDIAGMLEEAQPARRGYLPVPLVLTGGRPPKRAVAATAS